MKPIKTPALPSNGLLKNFQRAGCPPSFQWLIYLSIAFLITSGATAATVTNTSLQTPEHPVIIIPTPSVETALDKRLHLNFRGALLEQVLNYMAEAAGFTVVLETEVKGKVDMWSDQPLNPAEAVHLLNATLNQNGYAAIQNGRTLTIVSRSEARRKDIPVRQGNIPADIPRNAEFVTQVIPVRSLNVVQLPKDLAPLLAPDSTLTANESGNSLIMTDTQTNIRRIAEIIKALDSVSSSINSLRVLPLKYADAKALASVIKELFPSADSSRPNNSSNNSGRFRANGGGGNFNAMAAMLTGGDGGNDPTAGAEANGHTPTTRVLAVADDHSNSLIVSAPEALVLTIEQLVQSVDTSSQDITELRAFRLKNADAGEMADLLSSLFPDESNSNDANRTAAPFAFSGFRGPSTTLIGASKSSDSSERMKRLGRVLAIADHRTASVIVSSARDLMPQIAAMVEQLDANPAHKQKVFVYSLHNADAQNVQQILQELFPPNNNARTAAASQNNDPLTARSQAMQAQSQTQGGFNMGTGVGGNNNQFSGRGF